MERQMHNKEKTTSKTGWGSHDREIIAAMVLPMAEMQKMYGKKADIKLLMQGWEIILGDFSGEQICYALREYARDYGDDFPSPKNIKDILNPKPPRVTEAQYVQAQKWQERNNYPVFSDAKDTIEAYEAQDREERDVYKRRVSELGGFKRIDKIAVN